MPLPIYMDVHIPSAISSGLRRRGIDVLTSQEDRSDRSPDDLLFKRAIVLGRILFSQDDDMLALAARYQHEGTQFPGVIFAHQLSAGIGTLVNDLELVLTCCDEVELANRVTYLPLK